MSTQTHLTITSGVDDLTVLVSHLSVVDSEPNSKDVPQYMDLRNLYRVESVVDSNGQELLNGAEEYGEEIERAFQDWIQTNPLH